MDLHELQVAFQRPPLEHGPVPFWFLNEVLEPRRLRWQLAQMHAQHVDAAVMHPRPGMVTEYLSEEFWQAIRTCVDTARELGMRVWAYDEYPWASGIAGGRVPAANPDYVMKNLDLLATDVAGPGEIEWPLPRHLISLTAAPAVSARELDADWIVDLRPHIQGERLRWSVPPGAWRVMAVAPRRGLTTCGDPYGTQFWTDLTNARAIDLFIELTHEEYQRRLGAELGETIWALFTDEPPSTYPAWGVDVARRFRELKGYDLEPVLPLLWYEGGPRTAKVRCDYYDTIATLYEEAFFARTGEWCEHHGLDLSGHLLLEENLILNTRFMADAFRQLRHLGIPGIDWIFPGRIPSSVPKLAASIAHCYGRERVMSETFALAGWAADMQWMRWQTQWEFVHGVDLLVPHAFFYSISDTVPIPPAPDNIGYRWFDCPPSMFFRQPYWRHYYHFADLVARTSYLLTRGTHVAQAAVFYPITSVWGDFELGDGWLRGLHANVLDLPGSWTTADKFETGPAAVVTDSCYRAIIEGLRERALDVDIVDDDSLQRAELADGALDLGAESFHVLILPAVRTIRRATLRKVLDFWRQGGTVVALRHLPSGSLEEGANDPAVTAMVRELWGAAPVSGTAAHPRAWFFAGGFAPELEGVLRLLRPNVRFSREELYVQQRHLPDLELFYLTSQHAESVEAEVTFVAQGLPERWDPFTGTVMPIPTYRVQGDEITLALSFEPYDGFFIGFRPGEAPAYVSATTLRAVELHVASDAVAGDTIAVRGLPCAAGPQTAEVQAAGRTLHLAGQAEPSIELPLGTEWDFQVLPFPQDPEWHADMDRLELMFPPEGAPTRLHTGSWTEQGLPGFSGTGRYRQTFHLPAELVGQHLSLDLGQVRIAARVYLNGVLQGDRPWPPYVFELDEALAGENELVVEVSNTLANYIAVRHADSPLQWAHFKPEQLASGLLGPARIVATPWVELRGKSGAGES